MWGKSRKVPARREAPHHAPTAIRAREPRTGRIMRTFNLFISHSWRHSDAYERLVSLLRRKPDFDFRDYSIPEDDPIHDARNDTQLRAAIQRQMQPCSAVLILAGVYATYSKWINLEINLAKDAFTAPKPIVAIRPWGSERISVPVQQAADRIVGWNTDSVVRAIRDLA